MTDFLPSTQMCLSRKLAGQLMNGEITVTCNFTSSFIFYSLSWD